MEIIQTKKILMLEDQQNWQQLLRSMLRTSQFEVDVAKNCEEAENLLRHGKFDLVTVNINLSEEMQDWIGVELLKIIKTDYPYMPRIAITGATVGGVFSQFLSFDVDEVLIKGKFTKSDLLGAIENAIHKRKRANAPERSAGTTNEQTVSELKLPQILRQRIVDLLISLPKIHESSMRRTIILNAGFDQELQDLIDFEKPPAQFILLLIDTLLRYGKLKNGQEALSVLIETAKRYVGKDKQTECELLIQELQSVPLKQSD